MNQITKCKVLCVGMVCVDEIFYCDTYPAEDTKLRVQDYRLHTGGNAANNCTVLAELGVECEFLGVLSKSSRYLSFIEEEFELRGICFKNCEYCELSEFPKSLCVISMKTGSRTAFHYRKDWPEVSVESFTKLDLSVYDWIHFQGRNMENVKQMIEYVQKWNTSNVASVTCKPLKISLELEKPRSDDIHYMGLADVVFVSKDLAQSKGYVTMEDAVQNLYQYVKPNGILIIPWGESGACACEPGGLVKSQAFPPSKVVDTLGAGDTFCAAAIAALTLKRSLQESIVYACKVAGQKVGQQGYTGIGKVIAEEETDLNLDSNYN